MEPGSSHSCPVTEEEAWTQTEIQEIHQVSTKTQEKSSLL